MNSAEEAIDQARKYLNSITCNSSLEHYATSELIVAADYILCTLQTMFRFSFEKGSPTAEDEKYIIDKMARARLYLDGYEPAKCEQQFNIDIRTSLIPFRMYANTIWVEEWVNTAYKIYQSNNGFAGMPLKKYLNQCRPLDKPYNTPKRVFGKQQIDGEDTVDDED